VDAAALLATQPIAIQLRYLQTVTEIAWKRTSPLSSGCLEMFPLFQGLQTPAKAESDNQ
jgi:hypothetical protein